MTNTDTYPPSRPAHEPARGSWFYRAENWLDDRGKGAWIALMVLGFIFFWPIGLAILAYMIWSKRMFSKSSHGSHEGRESYRTHMKAMRDEFRGRTRSAHEAARPSGNRAFDSYKADTLRRLEDEQKSFEEFLERLREAKDKSEFDQFMQDRAHRTAPAPAPEPQNDGPQNDGPQSYEPPRDQGPSGGYNS